MRRIELLEKFIFNAAQIEYFGEIGMEVNEKLIDYRYRRINPRVDEIKRIVEIPGNEQECQVLFYSEELIEVKANFDELCVRFNDLENSLLEDESDEENAN